MYSPLVTAAQDPRSSRVSAERTAQIVLIAGLTSVIPGVALIIWQVGFASQPHHVALACIVAVIGAAFAVFTQLLVYRLRMKRASEESAET